MVTLRKFVAVGALFGLISACSDDNNSSTDTTDAATIVEVVETTPQEAASSSVLSSPSFYTETLNGTTLVEWVTDFVAGDQVADMHCTVCTS